MDDSQVNVLLLDGPFTPQKFDPDFFFQKVGHISKTNFSMSVTNLTHFHSTIIFKAFHGQEVDDIFAPAPAQAIRDCIGRKGGRCC